MKKALLVGINNYTPQKPLRGCVNDTLKMEALLTDLYGYTSIRKLLNSEASKASVIIGLQELLLREENETDGSRVFFFAGHGGRTIDSNADEIDRIDENLCMPDYAWNNAATYILDDDLATVLEHAAQQAPFLRIYVVFDSCHSGTATRNVSDTLTWQDIDNIAKSTLDAESPIAVGWELNDDALPMLAVARQADDLVETDAILRTIPNKATPSSSLGLSATNVEPTSHLLFSGCSAAQTCKDVPMEGDYHGIFSYCLNQVVRANPQITWTALRQAVDDLISQGFNQNPQLEGSLISKELPAFS